MWKIKLIFLLQLFLFSSLVKATELKKSRYRLNFKLERADGLQLVREVIFTKGKDDTHRFKIKDFKGVPEHSNVPFSIVDLNGDGLEDIRLMVSYGRREASYQYFIYDRAQKRYINLGVFPLLKRNKVTGDIFTVSEESEETYYIENGELIER